jgi:hypothetical protein
VELELLKAPHAGTGGLEVEARACSGLTSKGSNLRVPESDGPHQPEWNLENDLSTELMEPIVPLEMDTA